MELVIGLIIGLTIGGVACWLVRDARARSQITSQQSELRVEIARLEGELKQANDAQTILDAAKEQLGETFEATASKALQSNNKAFLDVANENFGKTLETAKSEFNQRHQLFQELVKPLSENYGKLNPQIETLTTQVQSVTTETAKLSGALTDSRQMGNWGEIQLRRVVEVAGMVEYCDFAEQSTLDGMGGRPDMVIKLPNSRAVIVDAKASTAALLDSQQATDEKGANDALIKHATALKGQVDSLAKKNYGLGADGALEFVVMFVPGDQFLAAALRANPGLIEYGMQKRVAIATPASLISLLWAVANGWQQDRIAKNAQEIQTVGEEMHKRMQTFINHYQNVGNGLGRVIDAYNKSVGSFDRSVVPQGRRFAGLVKGDDDAFPQVSEIDSLPRTSTYGDTNALRSDDEAA